jgi:hypothetical protein
MIGIAYLIFGLAVVLAATGRPAAWLRGLDDRRQQVARAVAVVVATILGMLGVGVLALNLVPDIDQEPLAWLISGLCIAGSVLYGLGAVSWYRRTALLLRVGGWLLLTVALCIPSTLTLALPLVGVLVPTLTTIVDTREESTSPLPSSSG